MKKTILILVAGIVLASCGEHDCKEEKSCDHDKKAKTEATTKVEEESHEGHSHVEESVLSLNDGEKWIANEATHVGMGNMQAILNDYALADEKSFTDLGLKLSEQTTSIINKCDMTGPDHDMLHKVLHPILGTIDEIKTANNEQIGNEGVAKLKSLLEDYFDYFQTK